MSTMLVAGLTYTSQLTVTEATTAASLGSGDLKVLGTPAMMALMENAAMMAVAEHLPEGATTVGGHIESSHLRPSAPGITVTATATLTAVDGRKLMFKVEAHQNGILIGAGTHLRMIVDRAKFLSKL